jgi:hypothetical protein
MHQSHSHTDIQIPFPIPFVSTCALSKDSL